VRCNFRYFAPRAASHVYAELKRLNSAGLARASISAVGRRPRTTYSITASGRRKLDAWLRTPIAPPVLEHEAVLRVLLAPLGDRAALLQVLEQAISDTDELLSQVRPRIGHEYLQGRAPFQDHAHVRQFVFEFITEFHLLLRRWAVETHDVVSEWDDTTSAGKEGEAMKRIGREMRRRTD